MGGGPGNILIRVGADASQAIRELKSVSGPLGDVQTRGEKMSAGVRRAAVPAAAALTAITYAGIGAAKAAAADASAQEKLAGALERTAGASEAQVASAEAYIEKLSISAGVADDELRPALARLASATGDVGLGQERLSLALDIAAQSGKPLEAVTKALANAEAGRTGTLEKLVPGLDKAALASKDMTTITGELAEMTGGAAAEAAGTAEGQFKVMQIRMAEFQEQLGAALLPILGVLVTVLGQATEFASQHSGAVKILVGIVAALAAGILVANVALKLWAAGQLAVKAATAAWTAVQWLINVALTANPIGIVVVAIAALVAGVIIAYKKSETFRDVINGLWGIIRNHPLILLISNFDKLVGLAKDLVEWIGKIKFPKVIADQFDRLFGAVKTVVEWIGKIDFPDPPGWLSKIPGVPDFGPSSSARLIGPGPLGAGPRTAGPSSLSSSGPAAPGGVVINVYGATDPEGTARSIRRTLRGLDRRQGGLTLVSP